MNDYSGWENYYSANKADSIWKDEIEPFLFENKKLLASVAGGLKVLDIACGDGRNTAFFRHEKNNICCVDIAETALKKLGDKFPETIRICCDFTETNLINNQFDIVVCFDGLPQMEDPAFALSKMVELAKQGGLIVFNFFTPNDCAYGEGEKIDKYTFNFKNTLFKFFTFEQAVAIIPNSVEIVKSELKLWNDPPHGEFRPYSHQHEASFFILQKKIEMEEIIT
jgi:ubiquinone/menaquinone biosynthesis C-methylase UbiE